MASIDKLHKQLEKDNQEVEIEIEVIDEDSEYYSLTPEEWELYKDFEAKKGNLLVHLEKEEVDK